MKKNAKKKCFFFFFCGFEYKKEGEIIKRDYIHTYTQVEKKKKKKKKGMKNPI